MDAEMLCTGGCTGKWSRYKFNEQNWNQDLLAEDGDMLTQCHLFILTVCGCALTVDCCPQVLSNVCSVTSGRTTKGVIMCVRRPDVRTPDQLPDACRNCDADIAHQLHWLRQCTSTALAAPPPMLANTTHTPCSKCVAARADRCHSLRNPCTRSAAALADAGTSALLAITADPSVLADATPSALLALTAVPSMLADATPSTVLAPSTLPPVLARHLPLGRTVAVFYLCRLGNSKGVWMEWRLKFLDHPGVVRKGEVCIQFNDEVDINEVDIDYSEADCMLLVEYQRNGCTSTERVQLPEGVAEDH